MIKQFKKGDRVKIVKDYSPDHKIPCGAKERTGECGIFIKYNEILQDKDKYPYIINLDGDRRYYCNDIELLETNKEIIGYESPTALFNGQYPKGTIWTKRKTGNYGPEDKKTIYSEMPEEIVETWRPVYKEDPKAGDWIYFLRPFDSAITGDVVKITRIIPDSYENRPCQWLSYDRSTSKGTQGGGGFRVGGNGYFLGKDFRIATPEEIKSATKIEIGGHKAEQIDGGVRFGCQTFDKRDIEAFYKLFTPQVNAQIKIKEKYISKNMLDRIYKLVGAE